MSTAEDAAVNPNNVSMFWTNAKPIVANEVTRLARYPPNCIVLEFWNSILVVL